MANDDTPFGLKPKRHKNGAPYSGAPTRYYRPATDATNIFIGDPVTVDGSGDADGIPSVVLSTAGDTNAITGVVVGVENLTSDNLSRTYLPSGEEGFLLVADDPDLEFEIQEDSDGAALAVADIGLNAALVIGAGNTTTGISAVELDSSSKAATATQQLRILGLVRRADNEVGDNAKWRVMINNHTQSTGAGA